MVEYSGWSNEDSSSIRLGGTWIQDPADPAGTIVHFRYGGIGRQESVDRAKTAMQFAGRDFPAYDIGEAKAQSVNVSVQINGEEENAVESVFRARQFALESVIVLYRDGRGRKIYGMMSDWSMTDSEMGSAEISFVVSRSDFSEELPNA